MSQVFSIEPIVMMTTGKITKIRAIFHKCPYIRARLYFYGGLGHTALSLKCKYYHYQWYSCLMEGKGSKKSQGGGSGVLSAPCDQDATLMVQNLYSERELSIKLQLGEKNSKKKLTFDHFRPTHTHTKLTFVSFFFEFFFLNLSLTQLLNSSTSSPTH